MKNKKPLTIPRLLARHDISEILDTLGNTMDKIDAAIIITRDSDGPVSIECAGVDDIEALGLIEIGKQTILEEWRNVDNG